MVAAAARPSQVRHQRYSAADRERRLAEADLRAGDPALIRIFKQESQLELWLQRSGRFALFASYSICKWSGNLGPKMRQGDKQAPEGFYRIGVDQLRLKGRNARSFYIDYPNALERALGRTGSAIMVHGGCSSIGCFAMTNPAMEEIYTLVEHALHAGQKNIEVHAFPFRMTAANLAANSRSGWYSYWLNLKQGYDLFEDTRIPPKVSVCGKEYAFDGGESDEVATLTGSRTAESAPRSRRSRPRRRSQQEAL
jgi:murein L,D-transpeptidase YafK